MKHSKSALILMELIIAILFFSLSSSVCIQLFVKSHLLSKQTTDENHAIIQAQNLAESFLASDGDMMITLFFDKDWRECNSANACYSASLIPYPETEGLVTAEITVAPYPFAGETIYSLRIVHHIPERRGTLDNE